MHLISPEELTSAIADRLARQPAVLVALDGRCGSGKTTLAAQLTERFPQSITVHTDDFYLPPSRRVTGWEKIPCANMDIQRLRDEVVAPARAGQAFSYQVYSCREGAYLPPRPLGPAPLVIVARPARRSGSSTTASSCRCPWPSRTTPICPLTRDSTAPICPFSWSRTR